MLSNVLKPTANIVVADDKCHQDTCGLWQTKIVETKRLTILWYVFWVLDLTITWVIFCGWGVEASDEVWTGGWFSTTFLLSVEPVQKHVNKCEQRIIPEHNAIILLKLCHEWHTTISVWARRNLTRGRWFKIAQKLMLKRNYNLRQSREHSCDVRAFEVSSSQL